jgi:hypothetical protein
MNDFNNRIRAQREVLRLINAKTWNKEALFGLSAKAIDRWVAANCIQPNWTIVQLVRAAAEGLFFLANKSQEQVTDDYKRISSDFARVAQAITAEMERIQSPSCESE